MFLTAVMLLMFSGVVADRAALLAAIATTTVASTATAKQSEL